MTIYVCDSCGYVADSPSRLRRHHKRRNKCGTGKHICDCGHRTDDKSNFNKHKKRCKGRPLTTFDHEKEKTELKNVITDLQNELEKITIDNIGFEDDSAKKEHNEAVDPDSIDMNDHPKDCLDIRSLTGIIDRRNTQFYFTHPPGNWLNLRLVGQTDIFTSTRPFLVIKIGCNGPQTGRHTVHDKEFKGTCRIIDSLVTPVAQTAEINIKDRLLNENKLFSGQHEKKKARDNELIIIRSPEEYEEVVKIAQDEIRKLEDSIRGDINLFESWKQKTEQLEAMFMKTEALLNHANLKTQEFENDISSKSL